VSGKGVIAWHCTVQRNLTVNTHNHFRHM
jgi:hypothetical protein